MAYLTIKEVETVVADYFRRSPAEFHEKHRREPIAWLRAVVMVLAGEYTCLNDKECAGYFLLNRGGFFHAKKRLASRTQTDQRDRKDIHQCRIKLDALCREAAVNDTDLRQIWLELGGDEIRGEKWGKIA